ncbi:MAG: helix-turn-helix domain-containing protein [Nesterenkonia sp.]|nr:helix-turn-helix domain-containing protein [Nesterenkonia sp.]
MDRSEGKAPVPEELLDAVLDELSRDASILEQTIRGLRAGVPGYESVPTEALEASARRNIALSIRTVREGRTPAPEDVPEADELAVERHGQGVPMGSVLAGFRICMSVILDRLLARAVEWGIPAAKVLECSTILWALGDAFSARAVVVYQENEAARAVADSARQAEWIGDATTTRMDPAELRRGAALYDVPTADPVRALVAASCPGSDVERLQRIRDWAERAGVRVLATVRASSLLGIVVGEPACGTELPGLTVGLGRPTPLHDLPRSFESASLALEAAEDVGESGVVDVEGLSWRVGIHASPETTRMLSERHLTPLEDSGVFGDHVLEAVDAYLRHRLSIPLAARSIPVHVNTLRYRLKRFGELTGADLGDVDTLVELSWVLAARSGRGPHRTGVSTGQRDGASS